MEEALNMSSDRLLDDDDDDDDDDVFSLRYELKLITVEHRPNNTKEHNQVAILW